jgi:hypothetical protein
MIVVHGKSGIANSFPLSVSSPSITQYSDRMIILTGVPCNSHRPHDTFPDHNLEVTKLLPHKASKISRVEEVVHLLCCNPLLPP